MRCILGVDIGFRNTGLILFDIKKSGKLVYRNSKCITTAKIKGNVAYSDSAAVYKIVEEIDEFTDDALTSINDRLYISVEQPHGGARGARAQRTMGIASAIMPALAAVYERLGYGVMLELITPSDVKEIWTGEKKGDKDSIQYYAIEWLAKNNIDSIDTEHSGFEHIADALGAVRYATNKSSIYKNWLSNE